MRHITLLILSTCVAVPAAAEVKSATPSGFDIENKAVVSADPAETYAALTRVGEWWNSEHTYSGNAANRSEEHTSELQSLMRISYAVFCLKKKNKKYTQPTKK